MSATAPVALPAPRRSERHLRVVPEPSGGLRVLLRIVAGVVCTAFLIVGDRKSHV